MRLGSHYNTKTKLVLVEMHMYDPASQAEKEQLLAVHGAAAQQELDREEFERNRPIRERHEIN